MIRKHHAIALILLAVAGCSRAPTRPKVYCIAQAGCPPGQCWQVTNDDFDHMKCAPDQVRFHLGIIAERRIGAPWEQGYHPFAPPPWIERELKRH